LKDDKERYIKYKIFVLRYKYGYVLQEIVDMQITNKKKSMIDNYTKEIIEIIKNKIQSLKIDNTEKFITELLDVIDKKLKNWYNW